MYKTILEIDGMACGMCESHVNDAIRKALPVRKVHSSYKRGTSEIVSDGPPDEEKVRSAVESTGYHVRSFSSAPFEKKSLFGRI